AFYYPRHVYLLMLVGYVVASFAVIAIASNDKVEKVAITGFFLLSVALACEVVYRLTTSWERARDALRESEQRFRTLSASAPIGIFQTDALGMCTYVNAHYLAVTGLSFEQSLGVGWQSAIHPEDRATLLKHWADTPLEHQDLLYTTPFLTPPA